MKAIKEGSNGPCGLGQICALQFHREMLFIFFKTLTYDLSTLLVKTVLDVGFIFAM
jgi:hypothetical protein